MSPEQRAQQDARNGKSGTPPSDLNRQQQSQYRKAFEDQKKNGKR